MIRVTFLLLVTGLSARADRLVARYDEAEKKGYFCHQHDGKMECRTNNPRMEFPSVTNPDSLVDSSGTLCALENGRVDCASTAILSRRQMPERISRMRSLRYVSGRLCGVDAGELVCLDDKTFAETSLGKAEAVATAGEYLVAHDAKEIRFWDFRLEEKGHVAVPAHEHLAVLDATHHEEFVSVPYCYVPNGKKLVCQIGGRAISRELKLPPKRLFANGARLCAIQEEAKGLRLECFNRFALQSRLSFVSHQLGREEGLRDVSDLGTCGIDGEDRLVCWRSGLNLEPKGYQLKGAHFTPQLTDAVTCVDSSTGAGCVRDYFPNFDPAPSGSWGYAGLGGCRVDAKGRRTCEGNFFTFDPPELGKVLNLGTYGGLAVVAEEGLHIGRSDGLFSPDEKKFWPHAWKSAKPLVLDAYNIYDEGTLWRAATDPMEMKAWDLQLPFSRIADELVRVTINALDAVCFLKGAIECYEKTKGNQLLGIGDHPPVSQFHAAYGAPSNYFCYVNGREVRCTRPNLDYYYDKKYPLTEYYPVVSTDGYAYYVRRRSGEVIRHDFWKGTYETLSF